MVTTAGDLPTRHVIHTVGPIYGRHHGDEAALLAACYRNTLRLAEQLELTGIAFPAISTGVYAYPPQEAARIASSTLRASLASASSIDEVRLVFFNTLQMEIFIAHQHFTA